MTAHFIYVHDLKSIIQYLLNSLILNQIDCFIDQTSLTLSSSFEELPPAMQVMLNISRPEKKEKKKKRFKFNTV